MTEIEELKKQLTAYYKSAAVEGIFARAYAKEVERLKIDIEAMRKDAERYRWLREFGNQEWERLFDDSFRNMYEGDKLDAAVDFAMSEAGKA